MRKILCAAAAVAMGLLAWSAHGATPAKKKAPARKSAPKSAGTPRKSTAHKSTAHASKAPARTPAVASRKGQWAPHRWLTRSFKKWENRNV